MLLFAGDFDAAGALFVERLNTPSMRETALMDLQDWTFPPKATARQIEIRRRLQIVRARAEVQAAAQRYGRLESFPIYPQDEGT
jgi:hypothetical protein